MSERNGVQWNLSHPCSPFPRPSHFSLPSSANPQHCLRIALYVKTKAFSLFSVDGRLTLNHFPPPENQTSRDALHSHDAPAPHSWATRERDKEQEMTYSQTGDLSLRLSSDGTSHRSALTPQSLSPKSVYRNLRVLVYLMKRERSRQTEPVTERK
ncbi:unnamed protein product [Pleuronectes platessa]|uniref:Uncharacterized protein n=1 Tax=Pleuronectes platessa TaxID=8262 RepID=A0A9N7YGS1_PLEPL|nr:unnamed protein product [Pleuronectes platessa]